MGEEKDGPLFIFEEGCANGTRGTKKNKYAVCQSKICLELPRLISVRLAQWLGRRSFAGGLSMIYA